MSRKQVPSADTASTSDATPAPDTEIVTFKGFDKNLRCRGFQFAVGQIIARVIARAEGE